MPHMRRHDLSKAILAEQKAMKPLDLRFAFEVAALILAATAFIGIAAALIGAPAEVAAMVRELVLA